MLKRDIFNSDHDLLREQVGHFLDAEVVPHHRAWAETGHVPADIWRRAGANGLLCRMVPEEYGGRGGGFLDSVVIIEELAHRRISGLLTCLQSDIVAPFLVRLGTGEQKRRYLPGFCSGEVLGAIALTEPRSGSDIHHMQTRCLRKGDELVLSGEKIHISNGSLADLVIVAARSDRGAIGGQAGISLALVEAPCAGLFRERIPKSGVPALDTARLCFDDCRLPADRLLGAEGMGFLYLMTFLSIERLILAIYAQASAVVVLRDLIADCGARPASAGTVLDYQNTQFQLGDLFSQCAVNQAFIDRCIAEQAMGRSNPRSACIAKLRATETLKKLAMAGVQLRGAMGISGASGTRATQDVINSCVQSIWGGTSEVLLGVIGRSLINSL
ncbi:acyl-CoA dehydrogenase [Azospirillum sp. TSH100]|uniref:acyl-CoA dehydrogenase family protein n=1 Tax=Azospirillum sp. TSH100 TaxID=652764 RepID=UPI000D61CEE0|nr:acyl-CoA dehydrogenase family protein [Azospirillum sp. TSH100]PWC85511.1 acyl-CoA dehydrogenase [Azospirillum sp. TSH100]